MQDQYSVIFWGETTTIYGPKNTTLKKCVEWAALCRRSNGPNGPNEYCTILKNGVTVQSWCREIEEQGMVPVLNYRGRVVGVRTQEESDEEV